MIDNNVRMHAYYLCICMYVFMHVCKMRVYNACVLRRLLSGDLDHVFKRFGVAGGISEQLPA